METRERWRGLVALVFGVAAVAFNEWSLGDSGTFYPKLYILAGAMIPTGVFGLAFGLPGNAAHKLQPLGYKIALFAVAGIGCAAGLAYAIHLEG